MLQDGVDPQNTELSQVKAIYDAVRNRNRPLAQMPLVTQAGGSQQQHGHPLALQAASSDYALSGNQVAASHPTPGMDQSGARGYALDSRYAIQPPEHLWEEFVQRRQDALLASFPPSTKIANDCHWNFWKAHAARWGCTTPIRDNVEAMSGRDESN